MTSGNFKNYLQPTEMIDSDNADVIAFTHEVIGDEKNPVMQAVKLYNAIRDRFTYDPYHVDMSVAALKASAILKRGSGFCVEKANLLAACARVLGIPSRLGLADVKNHIGVEKLVEMLRSEVFACHGFTELYLEGKWVKATPAFNLSLCRKLKVTPLEFNGKDDSVFQEYEAGGERQFMEYLHDHGTFDGVPREYMLEVLKKHYPHLFDERNSLQLFPV